MDRAEQLECRLAYAEGLLFEARRLLTDWYYEMAHRRDESDQVAALFQRTGLELVKPMREAGK